MTSQPINVLSISPHQEDHATLQDAAPAWALHTANSLTAALSRLYKHHIGVVLCERDLLPGTWIDMLERLALLRNAPPLIVTSRLADERLWAEALNLGAYDVLAKPFDPQELTRTVHLAWLHWQREEETAPRTKERTMAAGA